MSNLKVNTINDASGGSNAVLYGVAAPVNSMGFRNRIINGAMLVNQRGALNTAVTPANGAYTLDRFYAVATQASKFTVTQVGPITAIPFANAMLITSSSAYSVVAGDAFCMAQKIEGFNTYDLQWGMASAQTVTLSFRVFSSLTGTFGGAVQNSAANRSYPFSYTVSSANTWTNISITIAGDTSGTWVGASNGVGITLYFGLGCGSTFSGTAGAWAGSNFVSATGATSVVGTSGATFYITGVQLEAGTVASPFERVNYTTSLSMCQRYYCKTFNQDVAPVQNGGGAGSVGFLSQAAQLWDAMWRFPVEMRTTPATITTYSTNAASANWSTNVDTPTASLVNSGSSGLTIRASTPAAAGRAYSIHISASAEL